MRDEMTSAPWLSGADDRLHAKPRVMHSQQVADVWSETESATVCKNVPFAS